MLQQNAIRVVKKDHMRVGGHPRTQFSSNRGQSRLSAYLCQPDGDRRYDMGGCHFVLLKCSEERQGVESAGEENYVHVEVGRE